jgi:small subunit ribosomal protein S30e
MIVRVSLLLCSVLFSSFLSSSFHFMGKVHGSINLAGKVRNNTPKIMKKEMKDKPVVGRARLRKLYNKRILGVNPDVHRKVGPNSHRQ